MPEARRATSGRPADDPGAVEVPDDLAAALDASARRAGRVRGLPAFAPAQWADWVAEAKRPETRDVACAASWNRSSPAGDTVAGSTWLRLGFRPRPRPPPRAGHGQ